MPKGKKTCPKCRLELGVRVQACECGHVFQINMRVPVKDNAEVITFEKKTLTSPEPWDDDEPFSPEKVKPAVQLATSQTQAKIKSDSLTPRHVGKNTRITYVPAGECPIKPDGFKSIHWEDGEASEEVIKNWALKVYNKERDDGSVLHPFAVIYWARYFWDMNDVTIEGDYKVYAKKWNRVRDLISETLIARIKPQEHEELETL